MKVKFAEFFYYDVLLTTSSRNFSTENWNLRKIFFVFRKLTIIELLNESQTYRIFSASPDTKKNKH